MHNILHTKILCVDKDAKAISEQLGISNEIPDKLFDIVIDLNHVIAIRENENEKGESISTLYMANEYFTIETPYQEVLTKWKMIHG